MMLAFAMRHVDARDVHASEHQFSEFLFRFRSRADGCDNSSSTHFVFWEDRPLLFLLVNGLTNGRNGSRIIALVLHHDAASARLTASSSVRACDESYPIRWATSRPLRSKTRVCGIVTCAHAR